MKQNMLIGWNIELDEKFIIIKNLNEIRGGIDELEQE